MKHLFILLLSFSLLTFCSKFSPNSNQEVNKEFGNITMNIDMANAPSTISYLKGFLARGEKDTIFFDFEISDHTAHATVEGIEAGEWYLQVDAYNEQGELEYSGSTYVLIEAGKVTPVFLNLKKVTGGIDITISWGGVPTNMMLLMAKNEYGQWRILLMDENGQGIFDLIDGRYPMWINDQRDKFLFLRNKDELCEFDLSNHQVNYLSSLGVNANFLFYSSSLNRILFDYKNFGDYSLSWHLASVNIEGSDFQNILVDDNWEKYPCTAGESDWIYYHTDREGIKHIFRIKHDGSSNEGFITGNFHSEFPAFDMDGQRLVYAKMSLDSSYMAVVIHNMTTGQEQEINVTELGQPTYPTFSYNGNYVIFSVIVGPEHQDRQLFRYQISSGSLEQITFGHNYFWYARPVFW